MEIPLWEKISEIFPIAWHDLLFSKTKSQSVLLANNENKYKNLLSKNINIISKRLILKPLETVWLSN